MLTAAISSSSNSFTTSPPPPIPNSLENVEIVSRLKGTLGRAAGSSVILAANTLCSENDSSQSTNSCSSAAERTITQRQVLLLSDDVVGGAQEAVTAWQADHQERQTLLRLQAAASGDDNPPPPPPLYLQGFQETWSFGSSVRQDEGANYDIDHSAVLLRNVRRSLYASGVSLNGEASDFQNLSGVVQTPDQLMIMMADTESGPLQSNRSEENDVIPLFPATVLYNFESGGPQEISLIAGAFVTVYGKVLPNSPDVNINPKTLPKNLSKQEIIDQVNVGGDGWCQVENEIGETGLFPISYLEFMPAIDVEERDATQIPAKDAYNFMFDGDASSATDAAAAVILGE